MPHWARVIVVVMKADSARGSLAPATKPWRRPPGAFVIMFSNGRELAMAFRNVAFEADDDEFSLAETNALKKLRCAGVAHQNVVLYNI